MSAFASSLAWRRTALLQDEASGVSSVRPANDPPGGANGASRPGAYSVLHVVEALRGGPATYLREILPAQCAALGSQRIGLIVPRSQTAELPDAQTLRTTVFAERRVRALHVPILAWKTRRWVLAHRPEVVHAQGTLAGMAVRWGLLGVKHAPRVVYCSHGWAFDRAAASWKNAAMAWVERRLSRRCDSIVCISQHDYRSALKSGIERARLVEIRNAVSRVELSDHAANPATAANAAEVEWPPGRTRFLFVGRFDRQKGVDLFLQAMGELGDSAFAYAIGSPAVGRAPSLTTPDNVRLTGWLPRDRVMAYLASADVVVVPSRWEGFGLAALEAMRAGRPLIASKIGGLPELVRHGNTGWLVRPGDVTGLVSAMRIATRSDLAAMGRRARQRYERAYEAGRLNAELLALYERVLAQPPASRARVGLLATLAARRLSGHRRPPSAGPASVARR